MPIFHIDALPQQNPDIIKPALKKACCAIAEVYGCKQEQVWGIWNEIKPGHYVEGEKEADRQPLSTHPPVGRLVCFEGKSPEQIETTLLIAAKTLSRELGIEDNIFIRYEEAKSGRVVAGNGVIRK